MCVCVSVCVCACVCVSVPVRRSALEKCIALQAHVPRACCTSASTASRSSSSRAMYFSNRWFWRARRIILSCSRRSRGEKNQGRGTKQTIECCVNNAHQNHGAKQSPPHHTQMLTTCTHTRQLRNCAHLVVQVGNVHDILAVILEVVPQHSAQNVKRDVRPGMCHAAKIKITHGFEEPTTKKKKKKGRSSRK